MKWGCRNIRNLISNRYIQADLGDTAGSLPDHHNKANITIKQVTRIFWFPSVYKSYVHTMLYSIKCAMALRLRNVHTLIKNTLLLKDANHHLSLQQVAAVTSKIADHRSP